jgi:hypothetical protein
MVIRDKNKPGMSGTQYNTNISKDSKDVSFVKVYLDLTVALS